MDIHFECNHCGQGLEVEDAGAGITVDCPKCGKPVYVPTKLMESAPITPRVSYAPPIRQRIAPRVPKPASPYADRVKELAEEVEQKRRLTEYTIEPGVNQWKALHFAAKTLKVLAVLSILAWLLYPQYVWWHAKTVASEMPPMMGLPGVQLPSLSDVPIPRKIWLEMFGSCLLAGVFNFAGFWVVSDLLLLLIRLEQNTTRTVTLLQDRR